MEDKIKEIILEAERCLESDPFKASCLYKNALEAAKKNELSNLIKIIKERIPDVNQQAKKSFKKASHSQFISDEDVKKITDLFNEVKTLKGAVIKTLQNGLLVQSIKQIEENAAANMPISIQIFTQSVINDEGHFVKNGEHGQMLWLSYMYQISLEIALEPFFSSVCDLLQKNKIFNAKQVVKYLNESELFDPDHLQIINIGINHFFNADYISAMHILVPKFEKSFIYICKKLNLESVSLKRGKSTFTSNIALSERILSSKEYEDVFGDNLCKLINFTFCEDMGLKLRHRIAHGEITTQECKKKYCLLIIWLFLILSTMIKKQR